MHKLKLLLLAALSIGISASAQDQPEGLTARKCLKEAPESIFYLIDNNTRLDMFDYFDAGVDRASSNVMGGPCRVIEESPYAVTIQGGNGVEYEMFVLNPLSPTPIIGLIETVETPIPDSSIAFYNSHWHKMDFPLFTAPVLNDWMKKSDKKKRPEVEEALPFIMATYHYDPETERLTLTNNMKQYFVPSDTPKALSYINDSLTYRWGGTKFKLDK